MPISDTEFLEARIGQEVAMVADPGHFPTRTGCNKLGVITAKVEDRWGRRFDIGFADGSTGSMHHVMRPGIDRGIGCYLLYSVQEE